MVFQKTKKTSGEQKLANGDRWIFDKLEDREYSREEKIERLRKLVAYRKTVKGGKKKNTVCINNGKVCKVYDADLPIPEGWVRGFIKKGVRSLSEGVRNEQ